MALPYSLEYQLLDPASRDLQGGIIVAVAIAFFSADLASGKFEALLRTIRCDVSAYRSRQRRSAIALAICFIVAAGVHLSQVQSIPIFHLSELGQTPSALLDLRNEFSRYLDVSPFQKYLINSAPFVFGAPSIHLLLAAGSPIPAGLLAAGVAVYTTLSSAKVPFTILASAVVISALLIRGGQNKRLAIKSALVAVLIVLAAFAVLSGRVQSGGLLQDFSKKVSTPPTTSFHLGDYVRDRLAETEERSTRIAHFADYFLYRVIFTPVEVSSRWYEYFHDHPVTERRLERLIPHPDTGVPIHPAQLIGIEVYHQRFPNKYPLETFAYASFDADAFSRWGAGGLLLAILAIVALRLALAASDNENTASAGAFKVSGLVLLASLPATASVQSIIIAHGFPLLILFATTTNAHWRSIASGLTRGGRAHDLSN